MQISNSLINLFRGYDVSDTLIEGLKNAAEPINGEVFAALNKDYTSLELVDLVWTFEKASEGSIRADPLAQEVWRLLGPETEMVRPMGGLDDSEDWQKELWAGKPWKEEK